MERHFLGYKKPHKAGNQYTDIRNAALIVRYYYLSEIKRLRFDDVVSRLSATFFLSEGYIVQLLSNSEEEFRKVCEDKPTRELLRGKWPEMDWS